MEALFYLVPVSLCLGLIGLIAFLWTLRSDQYTDLQGDSARILFDDEEDRPMSPTAKETVDIRLKSSVYDDTCHFN